MELTGLARSTLQAMQDAAEKAARQAYAPYSSFRVGAALLLQDGSIVSGCNVENGSLGLTICAERSAMVRAVASYGPDVRVRAVVVRNLNQAPSSPCGACRQFLAEFTAPDAPVYFPTANGEAMQTMASLLPHSFSWSASVGSGSAT
jgi:cytidine deaminase